MEDLRAGRELRLAAAGVLQAIAAPGDFAVARAALAAHDERHSGSLRWHAGQALRACVARGEAPELVEELAVVAERSEWPEAGARHEEVMIMDREWMIKR